MSSDGTEERDFQMKLRNAILGITALSGLLDPRYVLIRDDDDNLAGEPFNKLLIVIHSFTTKDESHAFGAIGGQITFRCWISVEVENSEAVTSPLPGNIVGLSAGASLAIVDGALRNAFHASTLGGWCMDTTLEDGRPITKENLRDGCVGRSYAFMAVKEVSR